MSIILIASGGNDKMQRRSFEMCLIPVLQQVAAMGPGGFNRLMGLEFLQQLVHRTKLEEPQLMQIALEELSGTAGVAGFRKYLEERVAGRMGGGMVRDFPTSLIRLLDEIRSGPIAEFHDEFGTAGQVAVLLAYQIQTDDAEMTAHLFRAMDDFAQERRFRGKPWYGDWRRHALGRLAKLSFATLRAGGWAYDFIMGLPDKEADPRQGDLFGSQILAKKTAEVFRGDDDRLDVV